MSSDLDDVTVTSSNKCRVNVQTDGLRRDRSRRLKGVGGPVKVPLKRDLGARTRDCGHVGHPAGDKRSGLAKPK